MVPPTYPTVDESLDRLHRAGWSVGDDAFPPHFGSISKTIGV